MKAKSIIHSILEENAVRAKKIIAEDLTIKLGERLAEEYIRVAKQTFNEANEPRWQDSDGDGKWYEPEDVEGGNNTDEEDMDEEDSEDSEDSEEDEEGCGEDKE